MFSGFQTWCLAAQGCAGPKDVGLDLVALLDPVGNNPYR